jgi:hypothetical protein
MKLIVKTIPALCALCGCLLCGCASTRGDRAIKISVYMSGSNQTTDQSDFVRTKITDALTESSKFTVTERAQEYLNMIQQENAYQHSGVVDNSQIAEIGQKSGVTYVCVAELINLSDFFPESKDVLLTARFISVDSATVVASTYRITALPDPKTVGAVSKLLVDDLMRAMKKREQWVKLGEKGVKKENTAIYLVDGEVGMGKILQTFLINAVLKRDKYAISERTSSSLETLMRELKHQYSGEVADNQLAKLGKQSGVKYVITLRQINNEEWVGKHTDSQWVNIRMIDVTTGDIVKGKSKMFPIDFTDVRTIERSMSKHITTFLGTDDTPLETPAEQKAAEKRGDADAKPSATGPAAKPANKAQTAAPAKEPSPPKPEQVNSADRAAARKSGRDDSEIERVIKRNIATIQSTYKRYREQRRSAYSPTAKKIIIKISIDEYGKVIDASTVESTLADADIETALLSYVMKNWNFEKIDKPGDVKVFTFPIIFPADPPQIEIYDDYDDD